jgi:glutaredoxin
MQLPDVFEFTESECRTEAGIYEHEPYDITLELLFCMMTILIEESEYDREYCFSVRAITGATKVPQVFISGKLIGGSEGLDSYLSEQS